MQQTAERPSYARPGGYQMVYYTHGGLVICPDCANDQEKGESDPVIGGEPYYEGPAICCDDCNRMIESAYGDPDADDDSSTGRRWRLTNDAGDVSLIADSETPLSDILLAAAIWPDCALNELRPA